MRKYTWGNSQKAHRLQATRAARKMFERLNIDVFAPSIPYQYVVDKLVAEGIEPEAATWAWNRIVRYLRNSGISPTVRCPVCLKPFVICKCE